MYVYTHSIHMYTHVYTCMYIHSIHMYTHVYTCMYIHIVNLVWKLIWYNAEFWRADTWKTCKYNKLRLAVDSLEMGYIWTYVIVYYAKDKYYLYDCMFQICYCVFGNLIPSLRTTHVTARFNNDFSFFGGMIISEISHLIMHTSTLQLHLKQNQITTQQFLCIMFNNNILFQQLSMISVILIISYFKPVAHKTLLSLE